MSFAKALLVLSLFLAAVPLAVVASPHDVRALHHRHLAARVASPADVPSASTPRKRATGKRCRPRSSAVAAPTQTKKPLANVAPTPVVDPTTQKAPPKDTPQPEPAQPSTTPKVDIPPSPSSPPPPPPQKAPTKAPSPPSPSPEKSSTPNPPPATKPTTKASPPPSPTPPPTNSNNNSGGGGARPFGNFFAGTQTGEGTFYNTGLTACGVTNNDNEFICAVSQHLFDAVPGATGNPNRNPICGKKVRATYQGKTVTVAITDRCVGCAPTDLDFSPAAFKQLADFSVGRLRGVQWTFV